MPTIPFTERTLQSLKPLRRTFEYYEPKTSGLSVRVLPTGKKTFYLVHGCLSPALAPAERRLICVKLGRYPEVDLAAARDPVRTIRITPARGGDRPTVVLFKDLATEYIERHCKNKKKSWKQDVYWIDVELRPHRNDRPVGCLLTAQRGGKSCTAAGKHSIRNGLAGPAPVCLAIPRAPRTPHSF